MTSPPLTDLAGTVAGMDNLDETDLFCQRFVDSMILQGFNPIGFGQPTEDGDA